jgi:hypothetical protein
MELEAGLYARADHSRPALVVFDDEEPLELDRVEAVLYELVAASPEELLRLEEAGYYLQMRRPRRRQPMLRLVCA